MVGLPNLVCNVPWLCQEGINLIVGQRLPKSTNFNGGDLQFDSLEVDI